MFRLGVRRVLQLTVAGALLLASSVAVAAPRVVRGLAASAPYHSLVSLGAGETATFRAVKDGSARPAIYITDVHRAEVAHGIGNLPGGDSSVTVSSATPAVFDLWLFEAAPSGAATTASLFRDDPFTGPSLIALRAPLAHSAITVPLGHNILQTVIEPGGLNDTVIAAIAADGSLVGWDDNSAPGGTIGGLFYGASRLDSATFSRPASLLYVLPGGLTSTTVLTTSVLVNDVDTDTDGDGLGADLERQLGTCDSPLSPSPTGVRCGAIFSTRDTDRDGLDDALETFGRGTLLLPSWGASPNHKDMFQQFEIADNYKDPFPGGTISVAGTGVNEATVARMQKMLAAGPASDLRNPDGRDGIALHVDTEFACANAALCGNWGGSNVVMKHISPSDPTSDFDFSFITPERAHTFRTIGLGNHFGGSGVPANNWLSAPSAFNVAHEGGHSMGLQHYGTKRAGGLSTPCKPNYVSIMSYNMQEKVEPGAGYSLGLNTSVLDPANVSELRSYGTNPIAPLTDISLFGAVFPLALPGGIVDWNRDFVTWDGSSGSLRAPLGTAISTGECYSGFGGDATDLVQDFPGLPPPVAATPDLQQWVDEVFVFWVQDFFQGSQVWYGRANHRGPTDAGGCDSTGHAGTCHAWLRGGVLQTLRGTPTSVATLVWNSELLVAYRTDRGSIAVGSVRRAPDGSAPADPLTFTSETEVVGVGLSDPHSEISIAPLYQRGGAPQIGVFFKNGGALFVAAAPAPAGTWSRVPLFSLGGATDGQIVTSGAPGLTAIPHAGSLVTTSFPMPGGGAWESCMALPALDGNLRIYCNDGQLFQRPPGLGVTISNWADETAAFFPGGPPANFSPKPALAFHRTYEGRPYPPQSPNQITDLTPTRPVSTLLGQLVLATMRGDCTGRQWFAGTFLSLAPLVVAGPFEDVMWMPGPYQPALVAPATGGGTSCIGPSMLQNSAMSTLQATYIQFPDRVPAVNFYGLADHTYHELFRDNDDFQMMEIGLCQGLFADNRSTAESTCGATNDFGFSAFE